LYISFPISSLTDFLRLLRRRFPESKAKKLLGTESFTEFDKEYARLLKLEQQLKDHNQKIHRGREKPC